MLAMAIPSGPSFSGQDILSVALWIPFALVALVAGLIFAISGYNKGVLRSLIGFVATILAAVLSMLLANWLGKLLAPNIMDMIPVDQLEMEANMAGIAMMVVQAVVQYVIALVWFSVLMFILTIVMRAIGHSITKKWQPRNKLSQVGGMLVGLVCALTYTLLLLMPLYGTLATYAPVVEDLMAMSESENGDDMLSAYLNTITKHPVVQMSGAAPIAAVYNNTTQVTIGENGVLNVAGLAQTAQEAVENFQKIVDGDESQRAELCYAFILHLRQNFVDNPMTYDLAMEAVGMLKEMAAQEPLDGPSALVLEDLFALLDISREEFNVNLTAILDFALYALEHDGYNILMNEDMEALSNSDIVLEAGKLANVTDQAVAVKNMLWSQYAFRLCGEDDYSQIKAFTEKYPLPKLTDPKQLQQEARALMLSMGFNGESTPAEFVLCHPSLGEKVFNELVAEYGFAAMIGVEDPELAAQINSSSKLQKQYMEQLRQIVADPLGGTSLTDQLETVEYMKAMIQEGYWLGNYYTKPAAVKNAMETIGKDAFSKGRLSGGSYFYNFLSAYPQLDAKTYKLSDLGVMEGASSMWHVIHTICKGSIPTSMDNYYDQLDENEHLWNLDGAIGNDGVVAIMKQLNSKGTDPLGLGKKLSSSQKQFLRDYLQNMKESYDGANSGGSLAGSSSSDVRYEFAVGGEENSYTVNMEDVYGITLNPDGSFQLPDEMGGGMVVVGPDGSYMTGSGNMVIIGGEGNLSGGGLIVGGMGGSYDYYYDDTNFSLDERIQIITKFFGL